MDRRIVHFGALPQDIDILAGQRFVMIGLARDSETVLGTATLIDGFAVTPTTPASMQVTVAPGTIFSMQPVDSTTFGLLGSDTTHSILKQGVALDAVSFTLVAPAAAGYAQNVLVQIGFAETDTDAAVLPYYNAADPAHPYSGPANAGTADFQTRKCSPVVQAKYGTAAPVGTQTTPAPDAGFVTAYVVTLTQGMASIGPGQIAQHDSAPLLLAKLPAIPGKVQSGTWISGADTGTANAAAITLTPTPSARPAFLVVKKGAAANTGAMTIAVNGIAAVAVVWPDGSALGAGDWPASAVGLLADDGTRYQLVGVTNSVSGLVRRMVQSSGVAWPPSSATKDELAEAAARLVSLGIAGTDSGVANAYVLSAIGDTVVPKALFDGMTVVTEAVATNTAASTANVFGLGVKPLRTYADVALGGGEVVLGRPTAWRYKAAANDGAGAWLILPWAISPNTMRVSHVQATDAGGSTSAASGVTTQLTHVTQLGGTVLDGSAYATSQLTIGAPDAGTWLFIAYAALEVLTAPSVGNDYRVCIARNGTTGPFSSGYVPATGTYGAMGLLALDVVVGDVIAIRVFHNTGATRNVKAASLFGIRLSAS